MNLTTLLLLFCFAVVEGGKLPLDQTIQGGSYVSRQFAMFNPSEAPSRTWPGEGQSWIDLNYKVDNTTSNRVWFIIAHSNAMEFFVSRQKATQLVRCCEASDLLSSVWCLQPGYPAIKLDYPTDKMWYGPASNGALSTHWNVTVTGMYYSLILNCLPNNQAVDVEGYMHSMNPFGNLPGESWYFMPFFLSTMLVYFLMFLYWVGISCRHRKQLLKLQNWIGLVILCGLIENASLYFAFLGYNNIGQNYVSAMIVGTIVSSLKKTLSRVLILVVCMGFGVVKPTLGTTSYRVALLGLVYFFFSSAWTISDLVHKSGNTTVSDGWNFILTLPASFLNTWFYWWTLSSLMRTITLLQERKQTIKLAMYKSFFITLLALGGALVIIVLSQTIVVIATKEAETWKVNWIWEAFFEILYLVVLMTIMVIWRPIENNTRYAYTEMDSAGDSEMESDFQQVMLSTFSPSVQMRKAAQQPEEGRKNDERDES